MQTGPNAETTYTSLVRGKKMNSWPVNNIDISFSLHTSPILPWNDHSHLLKIRSQQLKDYVAKWLQFQSLWDLEAEYVFNRLGDSLALWQQLLTEIKRRDPLSTPQRRRNHSGACVIDYEQVQARVNAKYDAWQRDILSRFGVKLGNAMKELHATILKARTDLEHQSIEGLIGGSRRF